MKLLHLLPCARNLLISVLLGVVLSACGNKIEKPEILLASARDHLARNDTKAAVVEAKNALQQNPNLPEGRFLLGLALLRGGDAAGGEAELRRALELGYSPDLVAADLAKSMLAQRQYKRLSEEFSDTKLPQAAAQASLKTSLATAYSAQGEIALAQAALAAALLADPHHAPALLLQARGKAAQRDFDGAIAIVESVIARAPTNHEAWKLKGDLLWDSKGQTNDALLAYRKAVELKPDYAVAHMEAVAMLLRQGKLDDAMKQLEQLKKVAPNSVRAKYLETLLAYDKKDLKLAQTLTQQLLTLAPDDARNLQLAGDIALRLNSPAQAEAYLAKAVQLAPQSPLARRLLVATYLRMGQRDKALATLQPMLNSGELDAATQALAGDVFRQSGDLKKAETFFAMAAKQDPKNARVRTSLALNHLSAGQSDAALGELREIAGSSSDATADLALIAAHMLRQDFAQVFKAIDALEKKQPGKPLAANLRGRALLAKRDLVGARKSFERAIAIDPSYFPAVEGLALLEMAEKKPEAARQLFEALLAKKPKNAQVLLALANLRAMSGGTKKEVSDLLTRAVAANPSNKAPRLALVDFHLRNKDFSRALSAAQDAVATIPDSPELLDALGRAQQAYGGLNQAIATFKKLTDMQPQSALPHMRLALAYLADGNKGAADASLRKALEIKPDLLDAQRWLVLLAIDSKNFQNALKIAQTVQRQRPKDAVGYLMEGETAASEKKWNKAVTAYKRGLALAPSPQIAKRIHAALGASGNTAGLDKFAAGWLKDNPQDAIFRLYLGDVAAARREYAAAEKMYADVTRLQPSNAVAFNNLAWVSGKLKRENAVAYAEKAVALAPDVPGHMDTLAMLLSERNNYAKALEWQKKALALQPNSGLFKLNLAKIYLKAGKKDLARNELDELAKFGDKFRGHAEVASLLNSL